MISSKVRNAGAAGCFRASLPRGGRHPRGNNAGERSVGSGKDISKDKPAFGWGLEPFVAFGSISGNVSWGTGLDKKRM